MNTIRKLGFALLGLGLLDSGPASSAPAASANQLARETSPLVELIQGRRIVQGGLVARGPRGGVIARRPMRVRPGFRPGYRPYPVRPVRPVVVAPGWPRLAAYWWRPGAAVAAGAAIGFVTAATAAAWAGSPPAPGYCWFYTDASRTNGFWDVCPR